MLDHIYTESIDTLGVRHTFIGEYVSDHKLVGIEINMKKVAMQLDNQPRRQFKKLDLDNFTQEFKNEDILKDRELGHIWSALEEEFKRMLDEIVPERKKKKKPKPPRPWYTSSLLGQRKNRSRERIYNKYREQHHWKAFTRKRNRYIKILRFSERSSLANLVQAAEQDHKTLFKIVKSLLGKKDNPLPPKKTDKELAEDFATYFLDKIDRIK